MRQNKCCSMSCSLVYFLKWIEKLVHCQQLQSGTLALLWKQCFFFRGLTRPKKSVAARPLGGFPGAVPSLQAPPPHTVMDRFMRLVPFESPGTWIAVAGVCFLKRLIRARGFILGWAWVAERVTWHPPRCCNSELTSIWPVWSGCETIFLIGQKDSQLAAEEGGNRSRWWWIRRCCCWVGGGRRWWGKRTPPTDRDVGWLAATDSYLYHCNQQRSCILLIQVFWMWLNKGCVWPLQRPHCFHT